MFRKKKKILIIGPLPYVGAIGGVSIHTKRLLDFLTLKGFQYDQLDTADTKYSSIIKLIKYLFKSIQYKVVHIHISTGYKRLLFILVCRLFSTKIIMTLHGNLGRGKFIINLIDKLCIKCATIPIIINNSSYEKALLVNSKSILIPAFIPPIVKEILQKEIVDQIELLRRNNFIICSTNASNVAYDKDGKDLYGINFLIDTISEYSKYALLISDPSGTYKKLYQNRIVSDSIIFIDYPHSYFELLKLIDIFIRNTSTDGDSLSVKEALYLGKPVLCTDCVDRPSGCYLFPFNNSDGFLSSLDKIIEQNNDDYISNGAIQILELYKTLL